MSSYEGYCVKCRRETAVRRRRGRDGQRPAFGQGQVPRVRNRNEQDPGQEGLSPAAACLRALPGNSTPATAEARSASGNVAGPDS